jgi:hypothetical protein
MRVFCLYAGAGFRDEQLMKANHSKYCPPFWASCTWAEKRAWGTAALALPGDLCLVQARSSYTPMHQKASPGHASWPCRLESLSLSRDSIGHENRAFLAAGVGQARLRLNCVGSMSLCNPKRSQRSSCRKLAVVLFVC